MLGRFTGREVAVVGMGKSNQSLCRYLLREGARITCFDRKTAQELGQAYERLSSLGVEWRLGDGYLETLPDFQWIFLTPGMRKDYPEILRARERGAVISNETALFLERCKARVAGVTGSAGKTTTSTLTGMILRESFPDVPVYVGGNIGAVLIEEVDSIPADALVVLELSSFQLELIRQSPAVSLILNVRPNHLDIHSSFEEYVEAKKNIFRFQGAKDWCVLCWDDPVTRSMEPECPGRVGGFTLSRDLAQEILRGGNPAAYLDGDDLVVRWPGCSGEGGGSRVVIAKRSDFLVPGLHNVGNALGAALLAAILGADAQAMKRTISSFRGVEHRIEFVREHRGVKYYNDSIATSPDRTEALLEAIPGPLMLILGGYDKGLPFDGLAEKLVARGCSVVTMGKTASKIEEALRRAEERIRISRGAAQHGFMFLARAGSLEEAVKVASEYAKPGTSVVLSPACASFDMFSNFEERGTRFKEIVRNLA